MYIEFPLPIHLSLREFSRRALHIEFKVWAKRHNIAYTAIKFEHHADSNKERVTMPNDRTLELFALSWSPSNSDYKNFTLRR